MLVDLLRFVFFIPCFHILKSYTLHDLSVDFFLCAGDIPQDWLTYFQRIYTLRLKVIGNRGGEGGGGARWTGYKFYPFLLNMVSFGTIFLSGCEGLGRTFPPKDVSSTRPRGVVMQLFTILWPNFRKLRLYKFKGYTGSQLCTDKE